jgi:hypothetical protein
MSGERDVGDRIASLQLDRGIVCEAQAAGNKFYFEIKNMLVELSGTIEKMPSERVSGK